VSDVKDIRTKVKETLIRASTTYRPDQVQAYTRSINNERNNQSKWVMVQILDNSKAAKENESPLCDDTGIPHLFIEMGKNKVLTGEMLDGIYEGVKEGLRELPGRPMALKGNEIERIEQTGGLDIDPGAMVPPPVFIKTVDEDVLRLHILMQGGGPEIRGRTYRIFHKRSVSVVIDEIVSWANEEVGKLGCTPCSVAIGIGRSHYEAATLMLESMAKADFTKQNLIETEITRRINESNVGPLGIGGDTTALATFMNVGPQRASGVRIVCMRLCCSVEPRTANVLL